MCFKVGETKRNNSDPIACLASRASRIGTFFVFCWSVVYEKYMYRSFLSLTVEKTISYYYLLSLLFPVISYYLKRTSDGTTRCVAHAVLQQAGFMSKWLVPGDHQDGRFK